MALQLLLQYISAGKGAGEIPGGRDSQPARNHLAAGTFHHDQNIPEDSLVCIASANPRLETLGETESEVCIFYNWKGKARRQNLRKWEERTVTALPDAFLGRINESMQCLHLSQKQPQMRTLHQDEQSYDYKQDCIVYPALLLSWLCYYA